jgi:hypothetical protein
MMGGKKNAKPFLFPLTSSLVGEVIVVGSCQMVMSGPSSTTNLFLVLAFFNTDQK